jgi:AcrR family transcriptional regulator
MTRQSAIGKLRSAPGRAPARNGAPKNAALLGRKGQATKRSLLDAASRLLATTSQINLTAAAISKEAGTSPATFYVYFNNVEDILWALCSEIDNETSHLFKHERFLRDDDRLEADALEFVQDYCKIWEKDGLLLLYRNMESDRGNRRFYQLVLKIALPILQGLTDRIVEAAPPDKPVTRSEANADAVVFFAAIDRIAAALHLWPNESLSADTLLQGEARALVRLLRRT